MLYKSNSEKASYSSQELNLNRSEATYVAYKKLRIWLWLWLGLGLVLGDPHSDMQLWQNMHIVDQRHPHGSLCIFWSTIFILSGLDSVKNLSEVENDKLGQGLGRCLVVVEGNV